MTFVPTPRAELPSIAELFESTAESQQALLSYLFYQQEVASGFLAVVADLYRRLGGKTAGGFWTWADDALTPGTMPARPYLTGPRQDPPSPTGPCRPRPDEHHLAVPCRDLPPEPNHSLPAKPHPDTPSQARPRSAEPGLPCPDTPT